MKTCAILGASGHGKVIAEIAELNGFNQITFFDDRWPELTSIEHWPVLGDSRTLLASAAQYDLCVVAIGNNKVRLEKFQRLKEVSATLSVLRHPSAVISQYAQIHAGTVIMAQAVVNSFCHIDEACIINTSATVDHDCKLGKGVHVSPGANLAGAVEVGENTWIGVGSQVKQQVSIGRDVVVGAGSTVVKDVLDSKIVVGTPAHELSIKKD
ncbi:acetyltransferase [Vibrio astriarenae]|uniref:Acetyltransferase n=1 Tax=Vibrio astriarenae TaxID=1481923 RepID=A0A7Z2T4U7_9VIBR|nr:acetyltransferase [Vibrio astriarenae]QIA64424.1 acetyltransferase [Vibrio astriarenae]